MSLEEYKGEILFEISIVKKLHIKILTQLDDRS